MGAELYKKDLIGKKHNVLCGGTKPYKIGLLACQQISVCVCVCVFGFLFPFSKK